MVCCSQGSKTARNQGSKVLTKSGIVFTKSPQAVKEFVNRWWEHSSQSDQERMSAKVEKIIDQLENDGGYMILPILCYTATLDMSCDHAHNSIRVLDFFATEIMLFCYCSLGFSRIVYQIGINMIL